MDTAIQDIIDHFTFNTGNYSSREEILAKCKSLLKKEKQQIIDAYTAGCDQPMFYIVPEEYYNETFKH